ncbi:adenosylcobinamide-GDP ribazoletransferase [Bacillus sp. OAE603]|uniref:adenosylcobinamide-GDP ribazoletransferase n=1 Tax=Gottfriedia sp. OAE603 TaxID=2663872 RepID=UPI00178A5F59
MNRFKMILSFFSTIPVKNVQFIESELGKGIRMLPLVGIMFGCLIGGLFMLLQLLNIENQISAFFIIIFYIFLTGGLHLDGVADTCDGIFSHRSKERILEIMKDSRIGTFGVVSLIVLLLGDWIFLSKSTVFVIIVFPIIGRKIALWTCRMSTYAREEGFGNQFMIEAKNTRSLIVFIFFTVLICAGSIVFHQFEVIVALIFTYLIMIAVIKRINRKLDGITGDVIGFSIEFSQLCFLCLVLIGGKFI